MRHFHLSLWVSVCLLSSGCSENAKSKDPVLARAYAGPVILNLRAAISPDSKTIATAKHGEPLEVLQMRRRFVRVRTPRGQEGWTDSRQLLTDPQMKALDELAEVAAKLPLQGQATVYGELNMHTDPSRQSTSFYKIEEGTRFDVVAHKLVARVAGHAGPSFQLPKPPRTLRRKKPRKEPALPKLPQAKPPALPPNWQALSKPTLPKPPPEPEKPKAPEPKVPVEDWYLIRTADRKAGWVLARNVALAIPDEVAQYSEGARITSYFRLADVPDEGVMKHHWLWTTIRDGQKPYQFDSFRIFTWVVRRHRYETSYIERNVEGYYPVEAAPGKMPRFSLILREADGNLYRKSYMMEGYIVRKTGEEIWNGKLVDLGNNVISTVREADAAEKSDSPSLTDRIKALFKRK